MNLAIESTAFAKEEHLKDILRGYPSIAIGFSGGVDSAYLCEVAHEVLGNRARMLIADSPSIPRSELDEAKEVARDRGWNLTIIQTHEFDNEKYLANDGTRCYFCRSELFQRMSDYAQNHRVEVLAYGAMADDSFDPTRLGHIAAAEYRVVAPLQEADLHKDEIRLLSKRRGLSTATKASFACLASRFPTGTKVNIDDLRKIEAAEEFLKSLGFYQYRARHHGDVCRIEIDPADFDKLLDPTIRERIVAAIVQAGYKHVSVDLAGYRTGSTAAIPGGLQHNALGTTLG